uniref:Serine-rich adhesin for platelets-like isoform X5 n=1 Tax=Crassostrea virginica TaxID=6565 RepID=A0A8B8B438_CRAVI|nr:serine-rich adhesin for platelets-like isoform X5 [Crassostrea virginica]
MEYFAFVFLNVILFGVKVDKSTVGAITTDTLETSSILSTTTTENGDTFSTSDLSTIQDTKAPSEESSQSTSVLESTVTTSTPAWITSESVTNSSDKITQTIPTSNGTEVTSSYATNTTTTTMKNTSTITTSIALSTSTSSLRTTNNSETTPMYSSAAKTTTETTRTTSPATAINDNTAETTIDSNQREINNLKNQILDLEEKKFYFFIVIIVLGLVLGLLLLALLIIGLKRRRKRAKSPFEQFDMDSGNLFLTRQPALTDDNIFRHRRMSLGESGHMGDNQTLETFSREDENKQRLSKLQMIKDGLATPDRYTLLMESPVGDTHHDELHSHETGVPPEVNRKPPDQVNDEKIKNENEGVPSDKKTGEETSVSNLETAKDGAPVETPIAVEGTTFKPSNEAPTTKPSNEVATTNTNYETTIPIPNNELATTSNEETALKPTDDTTMNPNNETNTTKPSNEVPGNPSEDIINLPPPPPELQTSSNITMPVNEIQDITQKEKVEGDLIELNTPK